MRLSLITLMLVSAFLPFAGCDELREGMLAPSVAAPEGHIAYLTREGDSLYRIADQHYDRGWMMVKIEEANEATLPLITREDGLLAGGHIIFLPPRLNGTPLEVDSAWHGR